MHIHILTVKLQFKFTLRFCIFIQYHIWFSQFNYWRLIRSFFILLNKITNVISPIYKFLYIITLSSCFYLFPRFATNYSYYLWLIIQWGCYIVSCTSFLHPWGPEFFSWLPYQFLPSFQSLIIFSRPFNAITVRVAGGRIREGIASDYSPWFASVTGCNKR